MPRELVLPGQEPVLLEQERPVRLVELRRAQEEHQMRGPGNQLLELAVVLVLLEERREPVVLLEAC